MPTILQQENAFLSLYEKGCELYKLKKYDEALKIFTCLVENPTFISFKIYFAYATVLQANGMYKEALEIWALLILIDEQKRCYYHFYAANCLFLLNENQEALKALKETNSLIDKEHPLFNKVKNLELVILQLINPANNRS